MEFTCNLLNILLSKIFNLNFAQIMKNLFTLYQFWRNKCILPTAKYRRVQTVYLTYRNMPAGTDIVSDIPQHTGRYRQSIWHTAIYRQVQTVYLTYRNIPAGTDKVSDIPQLTGRYRQCIWHTAIYRKVQTGYLTYRNIPACTDSVSDIPQHTGR